MYRKGEKGRRGEEERRRGKEVYKNERRGEEEERITITITNRRVI